MVMNCMSLRVKLEEERNCSATVVVLDLLSGLSRVRQCSINRSLKRRFVAARFCIFSAVLLNHIDKVVCFTSEIRVNGTCLVSRVETCIINKT